MNEPLNHSHRPTWPHWHNQPFRLTVSEIENPSTVIEQFFQCYHLPDIRVCLHNWLLDSLTKETAESNQHVFTHFEIEKLVEAAWIIKQNGLDHKRKASDNLSPQNTLREQLPNSDDIEILRKPARLIEKAQSTPLFVIKEVFDDLQLDTLKEYLGKWLEVALSNDTAAYNSGEKRALLITFHNSFQSLIETLNAIDRPEHLSTTDVTFDSLPETTIEIIGNFFCQFPIKYVHRELRDWLHAGISYNGTLPENIDCEMIFYTYEAMACLLEAAYQI